MKRPHAPEYHSSYEEIASFIEGSTGEIDTMRIRAHLQSCDRCLEAYRYSVRYRGMHDDLPADDAPSREAVLAAKAIAQRDYIRENYNRRGKRRWIANLTPAGRVALRVWMMSLRARSCGQECPCERCLAMPQLFARRPEAERHSPCSSGSTARCHRRFSRDC